MIWCYSGWSGKVHLFGWQEEVQTRGVTKSWHLKQHGAGTRRRKVFTSFCRQCLTNHFGCCCLHTSSPNAGCSSSAGSLQGCHSDAFSLQKQPQGVLSLKYWISLRMIVYELLSYAVCDVSVMMSHLRQALVHFCFQKGNTWNTV